MVKILAVHNADPVFGERLANYVNQKERIPFTATALSSLDRPKEYGGEHPIEILLVDECSQALVGDVKAKQAMALCGGELVDGLDIFPSIYRYQSGNYIMREVLTSYCSRPVEPSLTLLGIGALVMGIYSPVSRCFKSSLVLTIRQVMAKKKTVLYLNLEEYSGLSRLISSECKTDLSDVLYLYRQGGHNWVKLKSMISNWGNMGYIPPVRYAEDLNQVAPENVTQLIDRIVGENGYDRLVVDVGQMGGGSLPILSVCDVVCVPVREDYISAAKMEKFEKYLEEADNAGVRDRIQGLKLPRHTGIMRREGYLEQLTWKEMGDYVRQLLNRKQPESQGVWEQ